MTERYFGHAPEEVRSAAVLYLLAGNGLYASWGTL